LKKLLRKLRGKPLFILLILFYVFPGQGQATDNPLKQLPQIANFYDFQVGDGILFSTQNLGKEKIIRDAVLGQTLNQSISHNGKTGDTIRFFKNKKSFDAPIIEFRRINPTKYRIRIHGARANFPLIFSEKFHHNWRLYIVPLTTPQTNLNDNSTQQLLSSYKVFEGNEETQVRLDELKIFIENGWVTDIKRDSPSQINPYYFIKKQFASHLPSETSTSAFISKKFANAIQNDNLSANVFWETWFAGKIEINCSEDTFDRKDCKKVDPRFWKKKPDRNPNAFEWSNQLHWKANSLVNSWWINLDVFPHLFPHKNQGPVFYRSNSDETIDFELIVEFWPQRLFYFGMFLSLSVFLICLMALFVRWVRR